MWGLTTLFLVTVFFYQAWTTDAQCQNLTAERGNITEYYSGPNNYKYRKCWNILNPHGQLLNIRLDHFDFEGKSCNYVYMKIIINKTGDTINWCSSNKREPISVYSSVTVSFYVDTFELTPYSRKNFDLKYDIDNSIKGIEGIDEALKRSVNWLMSNSSSSKWIHHIPKAVTALALASGDNFGGKGLSEELMRRQRELRIAVTLLRDNISTEQVASFINSILSTCHNPRNFYGHNLVELLKDKMSYENFTHPASYLALCNANEVWPEKASNDLSTIFESVSTMPFNKDYQAFAVMALSCMLHRPGYSTIRNMDEITYSYTKVLKQFMQLQQPSGSFGNIHRTAVISQALLSSVETHEHNENETSRYDWDRLKAVKFLMKSMKFPPTDFLSTYFILPLLNEKSLVDIAFPTNCSISLDPDDLVDEVTGFMGPKIQVQYSLFVEETKDVIHTIVLKVPKHFKAFEVMLFAAFKDEKYRFKYEQVSGKLDIYKVADIPNDPEEGKFWLFYLKKAGPGQNFKLVSEEKGPSETALSEGDHIAMWYKKYPAYI